MLQPKIAAKQSCLCDIMSDHSQFLKGQFKFIDVGLYELLTDGQLQWMMVVSPLVLRNWEQYQKGAKLWTYPGQNVFGLS